MLSAGRHFLKLSLAYALRPGSRRKLATVWAYLKVTLIDKLGLSRSRVRIFGWTVSFPSGRGLRQLFEEIFLGEHYALDDVGIERPVIVDAGANIGLATLYFKLHYPAGRIVSVEPHPASLVYLRQNIAGNGLTGVEVVGAALGAGAGRATLYGRAAGASLDIRKPHLPGESRSGTVDVPVEPLSKLVAREPVVDILKLDIEGAEGVVLEELGEALTKVRHLVLEYHRWPGTCPLPKVLSTLEAHGHDYEIRHWGRGDSVATCVIRAWPSG